jgi:penicillin-binding protein 1A
MSVDASDRPPRLRRRWRGWNWLTIPVAAAALAGALLGLYLALAIDLPQVEELQTYDPSAVTTLQAADGVPFRTFFVERRIPVPRKSMPRELVEAIVSVEDSRFYAHRGLDWVGIGRALWQDIRHRRIVEGGSTLTQQLAKVLFLTPEKSLLRKAREAILALAIERRYSKQEILTLYLNQIYLGEGAYGVEAAAQTYFGKGVAGLSLAECAMIAGIPRSPSRYSPISHPEEALARMRTVLARLRMEGYISREQEQQAVAQPPPVRPARPGKEPGAYFADLVRRRLEQELGENLLYRGGLTVRTTLDLDLQLAAEKAVADGIAAYEKRHPPAPGEAPVQAALLAMDPATGEVKALVGGRDFATSPYDRAFSARRQPGSAFKPVLYAAALAGGMTPATLLSDRPATFRLPGQEPWTPENFGGVYRGNVSLRTALEDSLNAASVDLLIRTGYGPVMETARRLGFSAVLRPYPSLALGVFDASLSELVQAYAAFDNAGMRPRLRFLVSVRDREGVPLRDFDPPELTEAIPPRTAFQVTNLLTGVVERGTARVASALGLPLAGKTGTTDDYKDAWFVGFSPSLVAGSWVGYDVPRSLGRGEAGSRAALPIWMDFMHAALATAPVSRFAIPPETDMVEVDPATGLLAGGACPLIVLDAFLPGTAPVAACPPDRHRAPAPGASLTGPPLD